MGGLNRCTIGSRIRDTCSIDFYPLNHLKCYLYYTLTTYTPRVHRLPISSYRCSSNTNDLLLQLGRGQVALEYLGIDFVDHSG